MDQNFLIQHIVAKRQQASASTSVMMERLRDFFVPLELGDQDLLFLCFVNLFSSGPLLREETDITNHMMPAYFLCEAGVLDFLEMDVQVNEQTFSICLISKCPWGSVCDCYCMNSMGFYLEMLWLVQVYSQSEWRFVQSWSECLVWRGAPGWGDWCCSMIKECCTEPYIMLPYPQSPCAI